MYKHPKTVTTTDAEAPAHWRTPRSCEDGPRNENSTTRASRTMTANKYGRSCRLVSGSPVSSLFTAWRFHQYMFCGLTFGFRRAPRAARRPASRGWVARALELGPREGLQSA